MSFKIFNPAKRELKILLNEFTPALILQYKNMINYLLAKSIKTSAALARIGQGYSPSRCQIIVRQNKGGVLNSVAKNLQVNFKT